MRDLALPSNRDYATETSKRLVPILTRETPIRGVPPALAEVNWLSFLDGTDFETTADRLVEVLDTDIDRVHLHTRLLARAREWETHDRGRSLLLRGEELKEAETWLANQTGRKSAATPAQAQLILTSRRGATRRQRSFATIVTVVVVLAVALSLFSVVQARRAGQQAELAHQQERIATSRRLAAEALTVADTQPDLAQLLSLESLRIKATREAWSSMQTLLSRPTHSFRQLPGHQDRVTAVAFSPDGSLLATGDFSGMLRLWDTATNSLVADPFPASFSFLDDLAFSPDGKLLAAGVDGFRLWDVVSRQPVGDLFVDSHALQGALAFSPDGKRLATNEGGGIHFWDVASRQPVGDIIDARAGPLLDVAFSPDGKLVAAGSALGLARTWDVATRQRIGDVKIPKGSAVSVTFSHDGKRLAIGGELGEAYVLDVGTSGGRFLTQTDGVRDVAFSPDDKLLATAGVTGAIRLWDVNTGQMVGNPVTGHVGQVNKVVFSPDGKRLATGSDDRTARLWNIGITQPLGSALTGHVRTVNTVTFSPNNTLLASGGFDTTARLWDVARRQPVGPLLNETGVALGPDEGLSSDPVLDVAFSPDGTLLATAGHTVRLWDPATGKLVGDPLTHPERVWAVAFSPDGKLLASTSVAGRNLSQDEWDRYVGHAAPYLRHCAQYPSGPGAYPNAHVADYPDLTEIRF